MSDQRSEIPSIVIDRVLSTDVNSAGQPIVFPQQRGQVDVLIYEIKPGAVLPLHKHPFPRMGYMLSGMLRVTNIETRISSVYATGDFALEAVDKWHKAESIGDESAKLLVIDLVDRGAENTVLG